MSRVFSALLQLANSGNVVILREGGARSPSQPFCLRLQSLDRPHQHFADYRAPSFLTVQVGNPAARCPLLGLYRTRLYMESRRRLWDHVPGMRGS